MPKINHRRGDTRRRCRQHCLLRWFDPIPQWNRCANRRFRLRVHQQLRLLCNSGYDPELCEDMVWVLAREADDVWGYD